MKWSCLLLSVNAIDHFIQWSECLHHTRQTDRTFGIHACLINLHLSVLHQGWLDGLSSSDKSLENKILTQTLTCRAFVCLVKCKQSN